MTIPPGPPPSYLRTRILLSNLRARIEGGGDGEIEKNREYYPPPPPPSPYRYPYPYFSKGKSEKVCSCFFAIQRIIDGEGDRTENNCIS